MRLKDVSATSDLGSNEARYLGLWHQLQGYRPRLMVRTLSNFLMRL